MTSFMSYITAQGAKNIPRYNYKGDDASLVLKYITNPIYNRAVQLFPAWVAPNLITATGMSFSIISSCILAWHCPTLTEKPPVWAHFVAALAGLGYQAFDAMDGKQARAHGSGSPYGMIFDHGCDAVNTPLIALTAWMVFQGGTDPGMFILVSIACLGFYTQTLEEYYTGIMFLPFINAPNEGIQILAAIQLVGAFKVDGWMHETTRIGPTTLELFTWLWLFSSVASVLSNLWTTFGAVYKHKTRGRGDNLASIWVALWRLLPIVYTVCLFQAWALCSPSDILTRHPFVFIGVFCLIFCQMVTKMMVCHVAHQYFSPLGATFCVVIALLSSLVLGLTVVPQVLDEEHEDLALFTVGVLYIICYSHLVLSVTHDFTTILGIDVFRVKPQPKPKPH